MPQVEVCYRPGKLTLESRDMLRKMLPIIVADTLTVHEKKEMRLTPNDIGVRFRQAELHDVLTHDVEISVTANLYPERERLLQEGAADHMVRGVKPFIPSGKTFYVWPKLIKAAFVESTGVGKATQD